MEIVAIGLALTAAVLHATWNAVLRTGSDRLLTVTAMTFAMTVIAIPFAIVLPLPSLPTWPFLITSSLLQVGYSHFLVAAYRHGELGQVYPVVRGSVPLLVTLGGLILGDQRIGTYAVVGVIVVASGIISLSVTRQRAPLSSVLLALATGAIIAVYTTIDSVGVRISGDWMGYATWICLLYGSLLPVTYMVIRRKVPFPTDAVDIGKAAIGGLVSMLAYAAVIGALFLAPAGPVTAIRETSVIFAGVIGWLFLGEKITAQRALSSVVVALGAIILSL